MKIDYTNLSFTQLIDKIEANRFFDLPRMVREAFKRLLSRVEALEDSPSGGIESVTGDYVDNSDPLNPILNDPRPYKVYTALLEQKGISAPEATILENTFPTTPSLSRTDIGMYRIVTDGEYPIFLDKTFFLIESKHIATGKVVLNRVSDSEIEIYTFLIDGITPSDNVLTNTPIEIRVYN